MSSTIKIVNNTNLFLETGVSVWITYFSFHRFCPGETWTFCAGKVWHSINAKLWDPRNQISFSESIVEVIKPVCQFLITFTSGIIETPTGIGTGAAGLRLLTKFQQQFINLISNENISLEIQDNQPGRIVAWVAESLTVSDPRTNSFSLENSSRRKGHLMRVGSNYFMAEFPQIGESILKTWINSDQGVLYERGWYFDTDKSLSFTGGPNQFVYVFDLMPDNETAVLHKALSLDNEFPSVRIEESL